jgi:hypothetical protein
LRLEPVFGLAFLPGNQIDLWRKFKPTGANGGKLSCVLLGIKRAEQDSPESECSAREFVL